MKEAIIIIIVVLMGLMTGKGFGYTPSTTDQILIQNVSQKIDDRSTTRRGRLEQIHTKFPPILQQVQHSHQAYYVLSSIYDHLDQTLYPENTLVAVRNRSSHSDGIVDALVELF